MSAPENPQGQWQPIETAMTGVDALFWVAYAWDDDVGFIDMGMLAGADLHRIERADGTVYMPHENGMYLTHWMPLPAPPESDPS